ncbi:hypothetical protein PENTCL1PPCAC_14785, partial [Pristionchus entomophagus]
LEPPWRLDGVDLDDGPVALAAHRDRWHQALQQESESHVQLVHSPRLAARTQSPDSVFDQITRCDCVQHNGNQRNRKDKERTHENPANLLLVVEEEQRPAHRVLSLSTRRDCFCQE